jgi:hypothetical protein
MKVYHGSDIRIEKVDLLKSRDFLDFGKGFYVTLIRKHAHQRALDIAERNKTSPVVTVFDYHEFYPERHDMNVRKFSTVSTEWVEFVIMNRDADIKQPAHNYDIVEGPIADDWVSSQIKNYQKGKITLKQLLDKLEHRELTHQICFCTPESLFAFEQIGYGDIYNTEEITNNVVETLMMDYDMDEKTAMDTFYLTDLYARLADSETGLHTKPWQEIYELLKLEIK